MGYIDDTKIMWDTNEAKIKWGERLDEEAGEPFSLGTVPLKRIGIEGREEKLLLI